VANAGGKDGRRLESHHIRIGVGGQQFVVFSQILLLLVVVLLVLVLLLILPILLIWR